MPRAGAKRFRWRRIAALRASADRKGKCPMLVGEPGNSSTCGGCQAEFRLTIQCLSLNNDRMEHAGLLDQLKFDSKGLIPLIVQDVVNGQVLMMAYVNREALQKTLDTGKVHTYSRSRGRLALKGESSRHFQHVKQIISDCDQDVVLIKVVQDVAACHEGYRSCFFREYNQDSGEWKTIAQRQFDPNEVYSK